MFKIITFPIAYNLICMAVEWNTLIWRFENENTYIIIIQILIISYKVVLHYSSLENQAWEIGTPSILHTFHRGIVAATPYLSCF